MDLPRSNWWIPAGALLLAAGYLPTLRTPFDFIDDGNLVYPAAAGTSFQGHVALWWEKVQANYEHLGPFRPTLWMHWQLEANLFGGDPQLWRLARFLWCGLAAGMLLWLFRELGIHPVAALLAGALAMWNPYRNEIWTSLTLGEGVAMPYALFALVAARKAANSSRPIGWDLGSALAVLIALGCKNTFMALVPAQIALRMWPDGLTLKEAWKANGWRSLMLGATLMLPAAHFVYFKLHWHPGQYETHGPTLAQLGRILGSLKGAMSLDFMALGLVLTLAAVWISRKANRMASGRRESTVETANDSTSANETMTHEQPTCVGRSPVICAVLLIAGGVFVYLPMSMMSGRYAMPGVWGLDILFAVLLSSLVTLPETAMKKAALAGVAAGLAAVMIANVGKQEKFAARARMLWEAVHHVEANMPRGSKVAWISGDSQKGGLNIEEGIHFQWHLYHRGRGDVQIGLFSETGQALARTELPQLEGQPDYRLYGVVTAEPDRSWETEREFVAAFWMGRKRYDCQLSRRAVVPLAGGAGLKEQLTGQLLQELRDPITAQILVGRDTSP